MAPDAAVTLAVTVPDKGVDDQSDETDDVAAVFDATPWVSVRAASLLAAARNLQQHDVWTDPARFRDKDSPFRAWTSDGSRDRRSCSVFVRYWAAPQREYRANDVDAEGLPSFTVSAAGYFRPNSMGPPGFVQGGAIGSMFDELLWRTAWLNGTSGPTANLTVRYLRPVTLASHGTVVQLEARIMRIETKGKLCKVFVEGEMLDGSKTPPQLLASSTGLLVHDTSTNYVLAAAARQATITAWAEKTPRITIPIAPTTPGSPYTALASDLLASPTSNWQLENHIYAKLGSSDRWKRMGLCRFVPSQRVVMDALWNPKTRLFRMCCGFNRQCCGPPGCVHGGCVFTVLDTTAAMFVQGHAADHLDFKERFYMTSSCSVDYKKPAPLDEEYFVDAKLDEAGQKSDRSRFDVVVTLTTAGDPKTVFAVGRASFVKASKPTKRIATRSSM